MRFVFFYDRIVNPGQILWIQCIAPNVEMSSFPTYVMKLIDGTVLTANATNSLDQSKYNSLMKKLQSEEE